MIEFLPEVHLAVTWFMAGLIWVVQYVHYPLWRHVGIDRARQFHTSHSKRIGVLVGVMGTAEIATALALAVWNPGALAYIGLLFLGAIWLVTGLVQVPMHRRLAIDWNLGAIRVLVLSNWTRTVMWSARGVMAFLILAE